jgi:hypothetical protein
MKNNQDLHDERISKLYRSGEKPEPPGHLDTEIKQAARAAAPTRKRRFAWPSLATAAVLVLSISLVLKVLQQEPLEDTVIGTSATNGDAISPNATLHEEKLAEDAMEQEGATVRRYRATKQKAAPTLAKPQTADAIKLEAAPATPGELKSQKTAPINCQGVQIPESDSQEEWTSLYQQALRLGDAKTATCLQQAYRARFNQAMPTRVAD